MIPQFFHPRHSLIMSDKCKIVTNKKGGAIESICLLLLDSSLRKNEERTQSQLVKRCQCLTNCPWTIVSIDETECRVWYVRSLLQNVPVIIMGEGIVKYRTSGLNNCKEKWLSVECHRDFFTYQNNKHWTVAECQGKCDIIFALVKKYVKPLKRCKLHKIWRNLRKHDCETSGIRLHMQYLHPFRWYFITMRKMTKHAHKGWDCRGYVHVCVCVWVCLHASV